MKQSCLTIILVAGEGSRMRSSKPKVLHEVAGLAMIGHVMRAAKDAGSSKIVVVVGANSQQVQEAVQQFDSDVAIVTQTRQLGTAHAVLAATDWLQQGFDDVLVLYGDVPLISAPTLGNMRQLLRNPHDLVVLGFDTENPAGYGRLIEKDGQLLAIREYKDATPGEREICYCNGGIMAFRGSSALSTLQAIENNNSQQEYYLTDAVEVIRANQGSVVALRASQAEIMGVNDMMQLAQVEELWQRHKRRELMLAGVAMPAPQSVYFAHDIEIGKDCTIEANVVLAGGVKLADNVIIKAFSHLEQATIASGAMVGPYARLRPGTELHKNAKVGNFCEVKKAVIGEGAKVSHLSYIGDATIGQGTNIGAGTITCNYDGINKHHTDIGRNVFIGSNSSLIAPLRIEDGAYVASGSVVNKDVPADALAIARNIQQNKPNYASKIRGRNAARKKAQPGKN